MQKKNNISIFIEPQFSYILKDAEGLFGAGESRKDVRWA